MLPEEEIQEARDVRQMTRDAGRYSEGCANEASLEFIKLEVQIAALLLALTGVLWNQLSADPTSLIKIVFGALLFLLIGSLTMGLLYLKIVEKFWDRNTEMRAHRMKKWQEVIRKKANFKDAVSFEEGNSSGNGVMIYTPEWPWVLQTILLGISVAIIICIAIVLIVAK